MANHVDLKPISRQWESAGHEHDEGLLRTVLLQRQQAELMAAQLEGWVPPPAALHTFLPCFAPPEVKEELMGTLSTATSGGLTAMDTEDDDAAAAPSQQEREAAAAAAAAARLLRRHQRAAEKEARRQQLLQVRRELQEAGFWLLAATKQAQPALAVWQCTIMRLKAFSRTLTDSQCSWT